MDKFKWNRGILWVNPGQPDHMASPEKLPLKVIFELFNGLTVYSVSKLSFLVSSEETTVPSDWSTNGP